MPEPSHIEAILHATTWCLTWGHEIESLELNYGELVDLFTERVGSGMPPMSTEIVGQYKLFGVTIEHKEFPRKSMIRTRYLQLINSPVWIERLAQDMEQYT